jgi:hypothetical protein
MGRLTSVAFSAAVTSAALFAGAASSQPTSEQTIVPRHTIIPVLIKKDQRVGGFGDAREQKKITAEVAQDIIIGSYIIAKQGDLVEGHFTTQKNVTKRVFSTNISQELSLDVDDVVNFCGDTIHMQFERTFVGGGRAGVLSFGGHAHDAVFSKGMILKAQTDRLEKAVCGEKTSRSPLPLPNDMVVPDEEVTPGPAS